ncbi:phagocytic receptor 1b [Raphidocelis subcapitata]|uniref:Transmembrane 9 superfamily member n=1 Tax=Raphidocelis subcapitata TaxID=307507 RepID=A0A2V0NP02_9CHLO|nr:phagocytic receptor 1b [Raphidocelis subcapitata]|eukprot:GBF88242.1 phagocytic receptor 1b [Raphidocelis subcapitata]
MAAPDRRRTSRRCLCSALALLLCASVAVAEEHHYKKGDLVPLIANKIGPYANPSETYQFYLLPFCQPQEGKRYVIEDLGEVLEGDRLVSTPYEIKFREDVADAELCTKELTVQELQNLRGAIDEDYYFQMFLDDDLPIWGFVGKVEHSHTHGLKDGIQGETHTYLFTHFHFDIGFNNDQVIEVNVSTVSADPTKTVDITAGDSKQVRFSYSVRWAEVGTAFDDRMDRYTRYSFLPQHLEIHWFSIINSCVTVLLLTGFLATILLRVLKNDFVKFTRDADHEAGEDPDESGWKYLHGDVFRFPSDINLFSAMIGVGTQWLVIVLAVFALSLMDMFYPYNRGAMLSACVVLYALTAGIAGYVAGVWYKKMGGRQWVQNVLLTSGLFCAPLAGVFSLLNTVAWIQGSTQALPFGTIVIIILIWVVVTFPLTVLGGIWGKNSDATYNAPCRTTKFPREVPPLQWYRGTPAQMLMAGFLPFSAIYIELYYIFASIWGHKVYTIYSILFIVFVLLVIVTAFITVALTYFQLAVEDHRWWWRSFLCGGSTALFVAAYCVFYYHFRSDMSGFMQACFFFGYNAVACYAFFLMLGTVGWWASHLFVFRIFQAVKVE